MLSRVRSYRPLCSSRRFVWPAAVVGARLRVIGVGDCVCVDRACPASFWLTRELLAYKLATQGRSHRRAFKPTRRQCPSAGLLA